MSSFLGRRGRSAKVASLHANHNDGPDDCTSGPSRGRLRPPCLLMLMSPIAASDLAQTVSRLRQRDDHIPRESGSRPARPCATLRARHQRILSPNFLNLVGQLHLDHRQVDRSFDSVRHLWHRHVHLRSAVSGSVHPTCSTARRLPARLAVFRSRAVFLSRATTPGTSASASPTRCSRSTFVTPTPTCRRVTATPSPAITRPGSTAASRRSIPAASGCGATGIAKLSADLTAITNLK
jgi:hypothetical protein